MPRNPALGQWIRQRRDDLGLTQASLADRLGCSLSLLRKIERGERSLAPDLLARLADILALGDDRAALYVLAGAPAPAQAAPPAPRRAGAVPAPPGPLIGRGADLAAVQRRLIRDGARLLTLSGPPGIGKTRLAQQVAADLRPLFVDGVCYVALAPLATANQVLPALARALELPERFGAPLVEQIADHLHDRRALLVLDNVEHLLEAAPDLAEILAACPQVQALATSRVPLRIRPEQVYPLDPLALPASGETDQIARAPAVQLFADRARALRPGFALDTKSAGAVAAICARLDGLPLAIELAAARLDQLEPADLLARLDPRLPMLADGPRDLPARQRTLHDAIAWSYELLEPAAQAVFARLGVFVGGCHQSDIGPVCGDYASGDLSQIVEHSLAQAAGGRIAMLETLREFARERLAPAEADEIAARHAAHFAALAELAEPTLRGPDALTWLDRLDDELANLRAAMGWSLAHDGGLIACQITAALFGFWRGRGYFSEGRRWVEPLLLSARAAAIPVALRASTLYVVSFLASQQGDTISFNLLEQTQALYRQIGDDEGIARTLNFQGIMTRAPGSYARAVELHTEAVALIRRLPQSEMLGSALNNLAMALAKQARYAEAEAHYAEAIAIERAASNTPRVIAYLPNLAETLLLQGQLDRAGAIYAEALDLARQWRQREVVAEALNGLGMVAVRRGDLAQAQAQFAESLAIYREMGLLFAIVDVMRNSSYAALRAGDTAAAAAAFRETLRLAVYPNHGDVVAHTLAGVAAILARGGDLARAAQIAGCAEAMRLRFGLRREPDDEELRAELAVLAISQPAAYALGAAAPPQQIIAVEI